MLNKEEHSHPLVCVAICCEVLVVMASEKAVQIDNNSEVLQRGPSKEPIATTQSTQADDNIVLERASDKNSKNVKIDSEPHSIYTTNQKRAIILAASVAAFFSPLSANIYLPALNTLAKDLRVSNSLITLTVTTYLVRDHLFMLPNRRLLVSAFRVDISGPLFILELKSCDGVLMRIV